MTNIDTTNWQAVGSAGANVVVAAPRPLMTPAEAIAHAAWLVTIAEATHAIHGDSSDLPSIDEAVEAVKNT